ncbi:MAG: macro domain-containing protein [Syntrophorhabdaceae bacterium]|nr:macro domain-containing protein [Syntrophorhabdaceae bacterium]
MEILKEVTLHTVTLSVVRGDLTESDVDAVVNAANSYLQHGGGVAGAIVRKGGSIIQEESNRIGFVPVGGAVLTTAGSLRARHVIHAVGPMWGEGDEENKLKKAVRSVLGLAREKGFSSIALPAISAGIFGFPKKRCAEIIVGETADFLSDNSMPLPLKSISFCLMDPGIIDFFIGELAGLEGR